MLHYGVKKPSPSHVVQEAGKKTTHAWSDKRFSDSGVLKLLEVRVNGSDVEVEKSTMPSKEARLNPSVRLPWFCRYHVRYIPAHELQLCTI